MNIQEEACSYILTTDTKAVIVVTVCTLTVGLKCAACHYNNISATGANNTTGLTFVATVFYCEHKTRGARFVTAIFVCNFKYYTTRQLARTVTLLRFPVRNSAEKLAIQTEAFRGFPQSLQANFCMDVNQTSTSSHILSIQYSLLSSHLTPCVLTYGQRL